MVHKIPEFSASCRCVDERITMSCSNENMFKLLYLPSGFQLKIKGVEKVVVDVYCHTQYRVFTMKRN